ncbi:AAA family ATPase [Colwellia sp. MEBiC06753]
MNKSVNSSANKSANSLGNWLLSHQQQLSRQIADQRLPHAILFNGTKGKGKASIANWLCQLLQCLEPRLQAENYYQACGQCKHCQLLRSQTFPDVITIDNSESTISVDSIRGISRFLETTPQIARRKVVLLNNIERMTVAAANALLKTLEEPSVGNILILTTENIDLLLPTIISRCQFIDIRATLASQFRQDNTAEPYANYSYMPEFEDSALKNEFLQFLDSFTQLCLAGQQNTQPFSHFEQKLMANDRSILWLERIISTLMRAKSGWSLPQSEGNFWQVAENAIEMHTLVALYQLVLSFNQQVSELAQANAAMLKQQLAINFLNQVTDYERCHG